MSEVKKQHFVPQFYFRRFADKSGQLFVFDKFTKKSFKANVRDVASERRFYDFHPDIQQALTLDLQLVEKILSTVEAKFSPVFEDMLKTLEAMEPIEQDHKFKAAFSLVA